MPSGVLPSARQRLLDPETADKSWSYKVLATSSGLLTLSVSLSGTMSTSWQKPPSLTGKVVVSVNVCLSDNLMSRIN